MNVKVVEEDRERREKHWEMEDNLIHKANLSNIGIRMVVNLKILVSYRRLEVQ